MSEAQSHHQSQHQPEQQSQQQPFVHDHDEELGALASRLAGAATTLAGGATTLAGGAAGGEVPAFAVLHRPGTHPGQVEILLGEVSTPDRLGDLPMVPGGLGTLAAVPFRQLVERGMTVVDDAEPLLALQIQHRRLVVTRDFLDQVDLVAGGPHDFVETGYDVPDAEYERIVRAVLEDEIGAGEGSNVVVHRCLTGTVGGPASRAGLGVFARLVRRERHAYWTFLFHVPGSAGGKGRTFVGATPERHVSVQAGTVRMNPISGTLRYADQPSTQTQTQALTQDRLRATLDFLADGKERDELAMVVDEELKMMADVCDRGGQVLGPYLKEMAHLAHTEYVLAGRTDLDVREVLSRTMFAPTVTGSPIRNACRIIARHENRGRGYYGGVLALLGHDAEGQQTLDAPILIRTAVIDDDGTVRIAAGATLVRGSRPAAELAETRAKAAGITRAFTEEDAGPPPVVTEVARHPKVQASLLARNERLADFWLQPQARAVEATSGPIPTVTVLHAEDDFTAMLAHLLRRIGYRVRQLGWDQPGTEKACAEAELLLVGPGPGDPRDLVDARIATLHRVAAARLATGRPVLGACLGHQVLALELGYEIERLPFPDQGVQRRIDLFGRHERVGFYNSFAARAAGSRIDAFRRPGAAGIQFHVESVLTVNGPQILSGILADLREGAG